MAKVKNKLKLIDAPVYGYWQALYMSFYSRRIYVDVGKRWRGLGLVYLLLAIAITSIPFAIRMSVNFNDSFNEQITEPLLLLPTILVQNGETSLDKPMPYLIKNKKGEVVLIVDTSLSIPDVIPSYPYLVKNKQGQVIFMVDGKGKITFTATYPYLSILITKNTIYFKVPTPQLFAATIPQADTTNPLSQTFGKGANFIFNGQKIVNENSIMGLKYAAMALIYPIVVAILYSMFVVIFLVLAFLGQVFSRIFFSFNVTFPQSSRLFMVATTPMLLILTSMLTADAMFPGFGFILLGILTIYFCFAIYSLKAESRQMVSP